MYKHLKCFLLTVLIAFKIFTLFWWHLFVVEGCRAPKLIVEAQNKAAKGSSRKSSFF